MVKWTLSKINTCNHYLFYHYLRSASSHLINRTALVCQICTSTELSLIYDIYDTPNCENNDQSVNSNFTRCLLVNNLDK